MWLMLFRFDEGYFLSDLIKVDGDKKTKVIIFGLVLIIVTIAKLI